MGGVHKACHPADSCRLILAFCGGSSLSADDYLFLSFDWCPGANPLLQIQTLALHAETDPCTLATTVVRLDGGPECACCSHCHELRPLCEGVSRFATMANIKLIDSKASPTSSAALLQCIEVAAEQPPPSPTAGACFVVCRGAAFATGPKVWPAAVTLCEHLAGALREDLVGARVLELGCGLGLPGILAALLGAE